MNKKIYIHSVISLIFVMMFGACASVKAEGETTFPVDEAGIAAYAKLDSVDITQLTEALNFFSGDQRQGPNYVLGKMQLENKKGWSNSIYNFPHLYIGLDGWIVAYYLKTEEASQIMQWKDYTPGAFSTTILKDAIDIMVANIGVTYSTLVKYYDFEFPEANKLTIIAKESATGGNFSVVIPGVLYEASYSIQSSMYSDNYCQMALRVDGNDVFYQYFPICTGISNSIYYGYYEPLTLLEVNVPHQISIYSQGWYTPNVKAATVLIYKN